MKAGLTRRNNPPRNGDRRSSLFFLTFLPRSRPLQIAIASLFLGLAGLSASLVRLIALVATHNSMKSVACRSQRRASLNIRISKVSSIRSSACALTVQYLQVNLADGPSFPKLIVRTLCEETKVKFELSV